MPSRDVFTCISTTVDGGRLAVGSAAASTGTVTEDPRLALMEQIAKQLEDARWRETQLKALAFKFKDCFETR